MRSGVHRDRVRCSLKTESEWRRVKDQCTNPGGARIRSSCHNRLAIPADMGYNERDTRDQAARRRAAGCVRVEDQDRIAVIALEAARRMIIGHMEHRD